MQKKSITFGVITTSLPLILGTGVGFAFGYSVLPAIVIGSLLASHTLLASYIIASTWTDQARADHRHLWGDGVLRHELVDRVRHLCVDLSARFFRDQSRVLLLEIAIFVPLILFGVSRVGAAILRKVEGDEGAYFAVMMGIVAAASSLAQVIQLPDIVGAFLSGLALNAAVKEKEAKKKLEFIGNSLFIPIFFVTTGFLIDPRALVHSLTSDLPLVLSIIGALVVGKFVAAEITGRMYGYTRDERLTVWSLTLPQVAATLAATLVAYNTLDRAGHHLLDNRMLHVVIALMLTTSILGPVLTERFAPRLKKEKATPAGEQEPPVSSAA